MSFEPGSTHIAHVTLKNEAKKPYTYNLAFILNSDTEAPQILKEMSVNLGALEEKTVDVPITLWDVEGITYFQISAYESTTDTDFGVVYNEVLNLEIVSPPGATVSISWD